MQGVHKDHWGVMAFWFCLIVPFWIGGLIGESLGASDMLTFLLRLVLMIATVSLVTWAQRHV